MKHGWFCLLGLWCIASAEAQIRIIPQEKRDSVANPPTLQASSGLCFPEELSLGTIAEAGGLWQKEIVWQNREASSPVVITGVKSSCGCLWAEYEARPLKRGEQANMTLYYNPKGHPGAVNQRLFVYTTLSATVPTTVLCLSGHVLPAADKSGRYPHICGPLLLRQSEVWTQGAKEVRIACLNGGSRPLTITEDSMWAPRGVRLFTEPTTLSSGQEGDLVIRIEGEFAPQTRLAIPLSGLDLPPRKRTVWLGIGQTPDKGM